MSQVIAFAGKGGTGKTTTAALVLRNLLNTGRTPVLAIDADPNSNLGEAVGQNIDRTIGMAREEFFGDRKTIPSGMTKESMIQMKFNQTIIETQNFDLLVMGRQEGAGCYCYINNILRQFIDQAVDSYKVALIDNEAGMEHLARRTARMIDHLIIVSDYSIKGLRAAERIIELIGELDLQVENKHLIVTRAPDPVDKAFSDFIDKMKGVHFLGFIPDDEGVRETDLHQKSFLDLPNDNPAVRAVDEIMSGLSQ